MMEKPINLLRGCARVEAKGAFPASMLNNMAKAGVEFWDTEPVDVFTVRFTVHSADLGRACRIAAASSCATEVLGRHGSTMILRRLRRRRALLVCFAVCMLTLASSSLFVWHIEVTGNEEVSTGEILRALDECGVSIGSFWPSFSNDLIRTSMQLKIPELRWMTVNVSTSRAEVIVRERIPKPVLVDNDEPVDVVARKTGFITKMSVLQGFALVKAGDAVLEGETLVTGAMESPYAGMRFVHAMAEIEASVWYELTAEAELFEYVKVYKGGTSSQWALMLGEQRINFYLKNGENGFFCDKITKKYPFMLEGVFTLPITLVRDRFCEYELEEIRKDDTELSESLEAVLTEALEQKMDGRGEVVSASFTALEDNGLMIVTLRAECREDISLETPLVP